MLGERLASALGATRSGTGGPGTVVAAEKELGEVTDKLDGDVPGLLHHAGDAAGLRGAAATACGQRPLRGAPAPRGPGRSRWGHPSAHGGPRRGAGPPGPPRRQRG